LISSLLICLLIAGGSLFAQNKDGGSVFQPGATLTEKAAAENLRRSAEAGSAKAQSELSKAYMAGNVFKQNTAEAVKWVNAAANQGLAEAEVDLAILYLEGTGVSQDYSKGFFWMKKAADQGDAKAEYNVGALYGLGRGVTKDVPEGIRWYLKAAEAGHQAAAYNMGLAYEQGVGVPRDLVKAYMWHYLAANRLGYYPSKEILRELSTKLGPEKVEEGRRQATFWIKAHPNVTPVPM
jgi:TPR repeat protein